MTTLVERVVVTMYDVRKCGYFAIGEDKPQFGSLPELLADLHQWAAGQTLVDTRLDTAGDDAEQLPVYLSDIQQQEGDCLFTMWNEVPTNKDGKMESAPANATVGNVVQVSNSVAKNTIPGFPTFFWLLPNVGRLATVRLESQRVTAQEPFRCYLEGFLATRSTHVVRAPSTGDDIEVWAYRKNDRSPPLKNVWPRFRTRLRMRPGAVDQIVKRAADIRKLHRSAKLELNNATHLQWWQQALRATGISAPGSRPSQANLRIGLSARFTGEEVQALVEDWRKHGCRLHSDDYGFQFKGSQDIHWLSGSRDSEEHRIPVTRSDANQQVDAGKLLNELMKIRAELLTVAQ